MRVIIKLEKQDQIHRALETMDYTVKHPIGDHDVFYAGNLQGWLQEYSCTNTDNKLEYNPETQEISYEGQRCPLIHDGTLDIMRRILGTQWSTYTPVLYETSDVRLKWWETLESYISHRSTFPEWYCHQIEKQRFIMNVEEVPLRFKMMRRAIKAIIDKTPEKRLNDEFLVSTIKKAKRIIHPSRLDY